MRQAAGPMSAVELRDRLDKARGLAAQFKDFHREVDVDAVLASIDRELDAVKVGKSGLDENYFTTRCKTDEQMAKELETSWRTYLVESAKFRFNNPQLKRMTGNPHMPMEEDWGSLVRSKVIASGEPMTVLMPELKPEQLEKEIDARERQHHLHTTKFIFTSLSDKDYAFKMPQLEAMLKKRMEKISALPGEIKEGLDAAGLEDHIRNCYVLQARNINQCLNPGAPEFAGEMQVMRNYLKRATLGSYVLNQPDGVDVVALDRQMPELEKQAGNQQAEHKLTLLTMRVHSTKARDIVGSVGSGKILPGESDKAIAALEREAAKIAPSEAAEEFKLIREEYAQAVRSNYIIQARTSLKMLEDGFCGKPQLAEREVTKIRALLKRAQADVLELRPDAPKTPEARQEMENYLNELQKNPPQLKMPEEKNDPPKPINYDEVGSAGNPMKLALAQYENGAYAGDATMMAALPRPKNNGLKVG